MASAILHIKDSYFFEVPKSLWRAGYTGKGEAAAKPFPDFWIRLDEEYQTVEAHALVEALEKQGFEGLHESEKHRADEVVEHYNHWKHEDHKNFGKPFDRYLSEGQGELPEKFQAKAKDDADWASAWRTKATEVKKQTLAEYKTADHAEWSAEKTAEYNQQLSGKILIPQPFGEIKNLHESASGFAISKFMIIEVVAAALIAFVFIRLAGMMRKSNRPKGRFWNLFEAMLVFLRDEVARPAIGKHDADRFLPFLWSIFFFVLFCNLFGMVPWAGAPTGAFGVTLALACVTFLTGMISGSIKFGPVGYWKNQVPSMDLPFVLAVVLVPLLFVIEVAGLLIKHSILGVRLLANMMAGHVVLLGIMALAFSLEGAASGSWPMVAVISVVGSTLFSVLELFVAFLQAYIFVFLSALFIGAAVHHH